MKNLGIILFSLKLMVVLLHKVSSLLPRSILHHVDPSLSEREIAQMYREMIKKSQSDHINVEVNCIRLV
jgi:hypothetical protein